MKPTRITTTEFYKNPSKALRLVKEGGTVYLAYKNLKDPIAVIKSYMGHTEEAEELTHEQLGKHRIQILKKILEQNKDKPRNWKSGLDLQRAKRSE
jgi:hypothetical protein